MSSHRSFLSVLFALASVMIAQSVISPNLLAQAPSEEGEVLLPTPPEIPPPSQVRIQQVSDKFPNGNVRIEREVAVLSDDTFVSNGKYLEYYENGEKFCQGRYLSGARVGEWTFWFDNGKICKTIRFNKGRADGEWKVYRKDETLHYSRSYKQGLRHGLWQSFDETGEVVLSEQNYEDGKPDGKWRTSYESGAKHNEISFKDGKREGPSFQWNEEGTLIKEVNFKEGKRHGRSFQLLTSGAELVQQFEDGEVVLKDN